MSKKTRENKGKSFARKAKALARIGNYYVGYREASASGKEYQNYRAKRGLRLPKFVDGFFQGILNKLLGKSSANVEGGI